MHAPRTVTTLMMSMAAAGALLLAGCGSGTTASAPTAATSAAAPVPEVSTAAPAPSAPTSSAPTEVPAGPVIASWTCAKDGEKVTCVCEGSEADCKSTLAKPSKVKGNSGSVVFFSQDKGYGFIADAASGAQYFVHISGISHEIRDGDCVQFDLEEGKKGFIAVNVKLFC
jgi:CspA family cold shock protein